MPEATLRVWERRYGLGATNRSDSGYRLYDTNSILAIKKMQKLIEEGWPVHEAAREARELQNRSSKSKSSSVSIQSYKDSTSHFFDAIENLDSLKLTKILDDVFSKSSFEHVIDEWLSPTMSELGERWQKGKLDIASEHFASHAIVRRISAVFESAGNSQSGKKVIIGAPSGSAHEIGSLAFATAARRAGLQVIYLGVEVPAETWVDAVQRNSADAVVLSVKMLNDVPVVQECITQLQINSPQVKIIVGGSFASEVEESDLVLEGNLATSIEILANFLA